MTAKPLRDIRIVDLTMGWSGPLATRHMADLGAEIIKVEACKYADWWRGWEHTAESLATSEHEKNPAFNMMNRNKLGVAVDLTRPEGQALVLKLIARADAVIENQATGVMAKLGLDFETLREANPEIIWLSLPAFGAEGPWSSYRGYGSTVEHGAGLPYLTGVEGGPPIQCHVAYGDACGGLNAASALLVGLFHKKRTGEGQRIEISQTECLLQVGMHGPVTQGLTGAPPPRTGNRHPVYVPHGCFAASDTDRWLIVAVTEDAQWTSLARVMRRMDLADDPSLATAKGRRDREDEIEAAVADWAAGQDADAAMLALQSAGVPAAAARPSSQLLSDPGYVERDFWPTVDRAVVGPKPHPVAPYRLDGQRAEIQSPAPLLGEHNHAVFCGLLGLTEAELAALEADGVIGDQPVPSKQATVAAQ
ncbi:MAG: CoA transferase [Pseudomonadota bacterium]